ncbi:type II toxin-antitoxin system Phd/YefM family antitoxin [Dulcicalothrix desertica]|nr:type II toxin-antitoxin system Phd/YefM family antitoxin [Dulcicalothrix desertica]
MSVQIIMLNIGSDINSLSSFKQNTVEFIEQLRETGEPMVLTVDGKAEVVVQDVKSYQKLLELVERFETIEAVEVALQQMRAGEGEPVDKAFKEIIESLDEE